MHCIVTAGPTYEPLDQVRRLTNFSTGRLGCELANFLSRRGHSVLLLKGYYSIYHGDPQSAEVATFTTSADLRQRLRARTGVSCDAVFHAAAVSDFGFGQIFTRLASGELAPVTAGKVSTDAPSLLAELIPTPKIIAQLRDWYPEARLIGWKFEVDGTRETALSAGRTQMEHFRTDACVVNGPAYGEGFGLLQKVAPAVQHVSGLIPLFTLLEQIAHG